jgi:hypothetical protein
MSKTALSASVHIVLNFEFLLFEFVSDFVLRISDFPACLGQGISKEAPFWSPLQQPLNHTESRYDIVG